MYGQSHVLESHYQLNPTSAFAGESFEGETVVGDEWYYTEFDQQHGPVTTADLKQLASSGRLKQSDLVWTDGMSDWAEAGLVRGLFNGGEVVVPPQPPPVPRAGITSKRLAAGVLAIVLGYFGVHKFVLGYTKQGMILLLVTLLSCSILSPITWTIGIIEGIVYLTKSDEEFYQEYVLRKKEWF